MAVIVRWGIRHSDDTSDVQAFVTGPVDREGVLAELIANLPALYGSLALQRITSIDEIPGHVDKWSVRVRYGVFREKRELASGDSEFYFRNSAVTFTRTVSIASRVYEATGIEDEAPVNEFGWRIIVPFTIATSSWRRAAGKLRGSTNADSFFEYEPGEVLMTAMQSVVRGDGEFSITLDFAQQDNNPSLDVGGIAVQKDGWEVVDVVGLTEFEEYGDPPRLLPTAKRVKVHQIKESKDWSILSTLLGAALD